jgi:hypothetical protein
VLRALNSSNTRSTSSDEIDQLFEDMDSVLAGESAAAPTSLPASARAPPSSDASNNPVVHQLNFKLAAMHWRQGQIRRRQKRPDDALDCYHKAEALFVASSGETSPEFASCMGGVGIIYRDSKKQCIPSHAGSNPQSCVLVGVLGSFAPCCSVLLGQLACAIESLLCDSGGRAALFREDGGGVHPSSG